MVGCLTGMPLCYFVLRVIRNPFHLRGFISQVRLQIDPKIKKIEIILLGDGINSATVAIIDAA
ncbi:cytochrome C-type biogenesis protein [Klebsiella pneumoniae]|uniref:Cytochrome C-type biogenesis protein n=1 Tax=Klebsiella pneumoniae TaxID=573 RepID=A0A378FX97_KLEPN|nr:cytochrome C-type biogenesis protein [Klebsiella pneumoniae]